MVDVTVTRPKDDGPARLIIEPTAHDLEQYARITPGKPALAKVSFPRNLDALRWYWAFIDVVADGIGCDYPKALHIELKKKAQFISDVLYLPGGDLHVEYQSVAIKGGLDEAGFRSYCILATNIIFRDYLPGVHRKDVWKRVEDLCGLPCPW